MSHERVECYNLAAMMMMGSPCARGDADNEGGSSTSLVTISLVCASSLIFYQLGKHVSPGAATSGGLSSFRLRRSDRPELARIGDNAVPSKPPADILESPVDVGLFEVPACARDVMLRLRMEGGGEHEHTCKGLLLSDDIIVTSRPCSHFNFSFAYPGGERIRAIPHMSLNSKMPDSRLGILKADPPYHYYYSNQPVRRARMFLSNHPREGHTGKGVTVSCENRGEPIGYNFPVDTGVMVPLDGLKRILPDNILWRKDIYTARAVADENHKWYSRPTTLKEEEKTLKHMLPQWEGPTGSVSIPGAHKDFVRKAAALMEVIDPRGHRQQTCFWNYYLRYRSESPFSGLHFFEWLDFGRGRHLLAENARKDFLDYEKHDEECFKKEFNRHKVHYFTSEERAQWEVYFEPSTDGKQTIARYKHGGLVPPSAPDKPHMYMWDLNETFYIVDNTWDKEKYGTIKHSAVVAGKPALSAGKAYFGENGALWGINFSR